MPSILKRLLGRHSTAVVYLALFAAVGGSAYARAHRHRQEHQDGTDTGRDVKNRSLGTNNSARAPSARSLTSPAPPVRREGRLRPRRPRGPRWRPCTSTSTAAPSRRPQTQPHIRDYPGHPAADEGTLLRDLSLSQARARLGDSRRQPANPEHERDRRVPRPGGPRRRRKQHRRPHLPDSDDPYYALLSCPNVQSQ